MYGQKCKNLKGDDISNMRLNRNSATASITTCRIAAYIMTVLLGLVLSALILPAGSHAARGGQKKIKLGTSFRITKKNASYQSSDTSIVWVNEEGIVTAKKIGKAVILIKQGNTIKKQKVSVIANEKKKKGVDVCTGEFVLQTNTLTFAQTETAGTEMGTTGQDAYSAVLEIKNVGKKAAADVVVSAEIAGKKLTLLFGKVAAGKTATVTAQGTVPSSRVTEAERNAAKLDCRKLKVYSNHMYTCYDFVQKKTSYHWGTADRTPPVITGFIGKNSYNQKMPYQVVYGDDKKYDYFQYVKATDDREGKVKLTVNTKKVDFEKPGIYQITYVATDKAGNVKRARAKIEVRKTKQVDQIADQVLSRIIRKNWSTKKKATAIYNYTRRHIVYVGTSNKNGWEQEAIHGIRYGRGDCFTYYAVARELLTRAGIPNIEVTRHRGAGHHWWNMVYTGKGWYHYDCGPRIGGGRFCLLTDAQLTNYSRSHGNKYIWNYAKIPKSAKQTLTRIF